MAATSPAAAERCARPVAHAAGRRRWAGRRGPAPRRARTAGPSRPHQPRTYAFASAARKLSASGRSLRNAPISPAWRGRVGDSLVRHRRQDGVRAQLQQRRHTEAGQRTQPVMEADGLADVADPVLRVLKLSGLGSSPVTLETTGRTGASIRQALARPCGSLPVRDPSTGSGRRATPSTTAPCDPPPAESPPGPPKPTGHRKGPARSGPFTAATPTRSEDRASSSGSTSASAAWTASIAPPSGSACINRPRAATSRAASSKDHTPATYAATSSPIECPTDDLGPHPERLSKPEERHLNGKQRRLRIPRLLQDTGLSTEHDFLERTVQVPVQMRTHLVQRIREHRERLIQLTPHTNPLTALTREQDSQTAFRHRAPHDAPDPPDATASRPARNSSPSRPKTTARCSSAARPESSDHPTSTAQAPRARHMLAQPLRLRPQRLRTPARHQPRQHRRRPTGVGHRYVSGRLHRRLLHDDMGVRAAHAERGDTRATRQTIPPGHSRASVSNSTDPADQSTCVLGSSTCRSAGGHPPASP